MGLEGKTYHRLLILTDNGVMVDCICRCGTKRTIKKWKLLHGHVKSCGCLQKEGRLKDHGMRKTATYRSWAMMLNRCYNPNATQYKYYGGKGIQVCEKWHNFKCFFEDMGVRPDNTTLDRENGTLGYNLKNCRWATKAQQSQNRSNVRWIQIGDEIKTYTEWRRYFKISCGSFEFCKKNNPLLSDEDVFRLIIAKRELREKIKIERW